MTRRLFFALAGLAVIVLILADVVGRDQVVVAERRGAVIDLEREAFKVALSAQDDLEHPVEPREAVAVRRSARRTAARLGAIAAVTDRNGVVVAVAPARAGAAARALATREAPRALGRSTTGSRTVRLRGTEYEVAEVPIVANQGIVGVVLLAQRSSVLDAAAHDRWAFLTPAFLVAIGLSIVFALLLARALTRPLDQLVAATRRVARERGTAPSVEPRGPAEVRELAEAFNAMSLRVRELVDRQSQFASDVSHQLRTPLTTMGLALEQVRAHGRNGDHDEASDSLWTVHVEVGRLQRLIEGLLTLTRVPLADAAREVVDVAAIAQERTGMWRALAAEHDVTVTVTAPPDAMALGVSGAVDQIIDNLIDNALEVAPAGSDLGVAVWIDGPVVVLAVTDHGPGMSDADRTRAFDRFWRGDGAARDGIGIGLTIVRDLTEACGGEIELLVAAGGGTCAVLTLEGAPSRVADPAQLQTASGAVAMSDRLRSRLRRYLRARDPERAASVEAEVWLACAQDGAEIDGCDESATTVFAMAHERMPDAPDDAPGGAELDAHLLRTIGGLDTAQIAQVLAVTPRTVERLERRARRTLLPVVDGRLLPEPTPRPVVPRVARVGVIAAVAVVVATGTAAATGSLPDPIQHQISRVLGGIGVHVPDPEPDDVSGLVRTTPAGSHGAAGGVGATAGPGTGPPVVGGVAVATPAATPDTTPTTPTSSGTTASAPATKPGGGTNEAPGQAKQSGATFVPPGQAKQSGATFVPPGRAKKNADVSVPPGQAKEAGS